MKKFSELKEGDRVKTRQSGMATVIKTDCYGGNMVKLICDNPRWACPYFYEHELDLNENKIDIKKSVLIRIAGQMHYSKYIEIDPSKLTNILKFPKDVFADIDGIRISIKREDFDQLIEENEQANIQ